MGRRRTQALLIAIVTLVTFEIARSGPVLGQYPTFHLSPLASLATGLNAKEHGMALLVPTDDGLFESEHYFLSALHHKPVLNSQFGERHSKAGQIIFKAAESPSLSSKELLEGCGIRYIIINQYAPRPRKLITNPDDWSQIEGALLISQTNSGAVYELTGAKKWPQLGELGLTDHHELVSKSSMNWLDSCTVSRSIPDNSMKEQL